jgi:release factor glutamine methyltransferase
VAALVEDIANSLRADAASEPRRLAMDIVAALLDVSRSWPGLHGDVQVDGEIVLAARRAAGKLNAGAPFAYAVGSAQFRHLNLLVDPRVLIPRPETEVLVGEVLDRMNSKFGASDKWGTAVDIGTGSGAIALALASEGRFDRVIATDVSHDAIDAARENARRSAIALNCDVELRCGSFTTPLTDVRATVVVSNPPYIAYSEIAALPQSVRDWEPPLALLAADNGMDAIAKIVSGAARILLGGGLLALEVDERRASLAAEIVMGSGQYSEVGVRLDLTGRERFVLATRI